MLIVIMQPRRAARRALILRIMIRLIYPLTITMDLHSDRLHNAITRHREIDARDGGRVAARVVESGALVVPCSRFRGHHGVDAVSFRLGGQLERCAVAGLSL